VAADLIIDLSGAYEIKKMAMLVRISPQKTPLTRSSIYFQKLSAPFSYHMISAKPPLMGFLMQALAAISDSDLNDCPDERKIRYLREVK